MANQTTNWTAPKGCFAHHRALLERHVNAQPSHWREDPVKGEVFADRKEAEARLQLYALVRGFDVVAGGGGSAASPAVNIQCIHHGIVTLNTRKLEDRVMRDEEGVITSMRKRDDTAVRQTGCDWRVRVSFMAINRRNATAGREWRLT